MRSESAINIKAGWCNVSENETHPEGPMNASPRWHLKIKRQLLIWGEKKILVCVYTYTYIYMYISDLRVYMTERETKLSLLYSVNEVVILESCFPGNRKIRMIKRKKKWL